MQLLKPEQYASLHNKYDEKIEYFPIITSVIEQIQQGYIVIQNDTYMIVHKFGFSYILGDLRNTDNFIQNAKQFISPFVSKLRIYDPNAKLKSDEKLRIYKSTRLKYIYDKKAPHLLKSIDIFSIKKSAADFWSLFGLDLCSRYWNSCHDFKTKSLGVVNKNGTGICYGAAVVKNFCELDIYVEQSKRNNKTGTNLTEHFCQNCLQNGITPLWDCYSNNLASAKLAQKIGFKKLFEYDYYNIEG
ncbi:MAG: GNAT family N-acetyltransferase [Sulfurimonas sp.]|jgi:hypothetical protein